MTGNYITPGGTPPQLSRADLAALSPEDVVRADDMHQLEVLKSGRDPLDFERTGQRKATPAEDAQARADQAEAARQAHNRQQHDLRTTNRTEQE
jgi:hypothetical protein